MKKHCEKLIILSTLSALAYGFYRLFTFWIRPFGGNEGWITKTKSSFIWQRITICFWRVVFTLFNKFEIINKHYIPTDPNQNFVTIANHASIVDGFIVGATIWKPMYFMVKKEAFDKPWEGYYLRKVYCFPVDRSRPDPLAIKTAMKHLTDGDILGIFPEGTRNRDGYVSEFKPGAIKLALKKKLPIIPLYIANSHNITPKGSILIKPAKLTVIVLEPIDTKKELESGKTEKELLEMIYKRITEAGTKFMGYDVRDPKLIK